MANGLKIVVEADNTDKVLRQLDEAIPRALEIIGGKAEGYVKGLTPVKTGRLRGSMTYKTSSGGSAPESPAKGGDGVSGTPTEKQVFVGTNVEYAASVEFGTQGRQPKHMIKRGIEDHISEYQNILKTELESG